MIKQLYYTLIAPFQGLNEFLFGDDHRIISREGREILDEGKPYTLKIDEDGYTIINVEDDDD